MTDTTNNYTYALECVQQPQRARMCGFGDKDRRPITPAPCVRLIVKNAITGLEVDYHEIDTTHYVVLIELRDSHYKDVNLVTSSAGAAQNSISSSKTTSYPPEKQSPQSTTPGLHLHTNGGSLYQSHGMAPVMPQTMYGNQGSYGSTVSYTNYAHPYGMPQHWNPLPQMNAYLPAPPMTSLVQPHYPSMPRQQAMMGGGTAYHRNLIGQLACNAFKLKDDQSVWGIWFVLSDLSIRTEGHFRLLIRFFDLSAISRPSLNPDDQSNVASRAAKPLATCYTDTLQVYSAKKFPGVTDGTPLSKAFSNQGVKIPVRKEEKKGGGGDDGGDGYDDE